VGRRKNLQHQKSQTLSRHGLILEMEVGFVSDTIMNHGLPDWGAEPNVAQRRMEYSNAPTEKKRNNNNNNNKSMEFEVYTR
jgi:hypothetical protein